MKKAKTTYGQSIVEYTARYGKAPTVCEIENLYHGYANEWKHFNGFTDWVIYHEQPHKSAAPVRQ